MNIYLKILCVCAHTQWERCYWYLKQGHKIKITQTHTHTYMHIDTYVRRHTLTDTHRYTPSIRETDKRVQTDDCNGRFIAELFIRRLEI